MAVGEPWARSGTTTVRGGRIVVGVDGSLGVLTAVSWAAAEAARRHGDLHLVHVKPGGAESAWSGRALGTVAAIAPGLSVGLGTGCGDAGPALVARSTDARLLVVGGRRPGDTARPGDHTVAHLVRNARCPLVVVPPRRTGAWASTPSGRPVIAALGGEADPADDQHVLDLALDAARGRRAPVIVIGGGDPGDPVREPLVRRARARGARWLGGTGPLGPTLREAGRRAQLIVIGPAVPTVAAALTARGPCPVMVVPTPRTGVAGERRRAAVLAEPVGARRDER